MLLGIRWPPGGVGGRGCVGGRLECAPTLAGRFKGGGASALSWERACLTTTASQWRRCVFFVLGAGLHERGMSLVHMLGLQAQACVCAQMQPLFCALACLAVYCSEQDTWTCECIHPYHKHLGMAHIPQECPKQKDGVHRAPSHTNLKGTPKKGQAASNIHARKRRMATKQMLTHHGWPHPVHSILHRQHARGADARVEGRVDEWLVTKAACCKKEAR
eukprot:scaffold71679_cov20-Tisochrysis_lutea.AAC.2